LEKLDSRLAMTLSRVGLTGSGYGWISVRS
jgi:hypothetical protein